MMGSVTKNGVSFTANIVADLKSGYVKPDITNLGIPCKAYTFDSVNDLKAEIAKYLSQESLVKYVRQGYLPNVNKPTKKD
jgi:hypothetical protein